MTHWLDKIIQLLEAETADLRELARLGGGNPESFYIGTDIDGADLRGQDLRGMFFGEFDPRTVLVDERTQLTAELIDAFESFRRSEASSGDQASAVGHLGSWADALSGNLAIDLDSGTTRIFRQGRGVVVEEPSVYLARSGSEARGIVAGSAAIGRYRAADDGSLALVNPFRAGNIADERYGTTLMRLLLKQGLGRSRIGGSAVLSVPYEATPLQRRTLTRVMKNVGARSVSLIDRGLSSAIGAGLPVHELRGALVVDVGYSTTDIAVVCLSGTVVGRTVAAGIATMEAAIRDSISRIYMTQISEDDAELLRAEFGTARADMPTVATVLVRGAHTKTGELKQFMIPTTTITNAMYESVGAIIDALKVVVEETPPEVSVEVAEDGILLTGVGATISGLDAELRDHTGLPVRIARDPQLCALLGCAKALAAPTWGKAIASESMPIART